LYAGRDLLEETEPLATQTGIGVSKSRNVPAGTWQAGDKPAPNAPSIGRKRRSIRRVIVRFSSARCNGLKTTTGPSIGAVRRGPLEGPAGLPRRSQRYFRQPETRVEACDQAIARQEPRADFCRRHRNRQRSERNQTASYRSRRVCGKIRAPPALLDVRWAATPPSGRFPTRRQESLLRRQD